MREGDAHALFYRFDKMHMHCFIDLIKYVLAFQGGEVENAKKLYIRIFWSRDSKHLQEYSFICF